MFKTRGIGVMLVGAGLVAARGNAISEGPAAMPERPLGEWRYYSGDKGATKYSPLDQINRSHVAGLTIAWRRPHDRRRPEVIEQADVSRLRRSARAVSSTSVPMSNRVAVAPRGIR